MNKCLPLLGAALGLALLVTGCETDGSSRVQEKSAVYATLKPWQKKYVDTGVPAVGFTPDMIYMAIGNPSTKKSVAEGSEIWIYKNYYPSVGADKVKYSLTTEKSMDHNVIGGMLMENTGGIAGGQRPAGSTQGGTTGSISQTGGPQGGSMEPADLASYTLYVAFQKGVVTQMRLDPN
jgi:hypothetical protein